MAEDSKGNTNIYGAVKKLTQIGNVEGNVVIQSVPALAIDFDRIQGSHTSKAENFAELCNLIISQEYADANLKILEHKDDDNEIDCFMGDLSDYIHAFQHKYTTGRIEELDQRQIAELLASACLNYNIAKWTLCIPTSFLPREREWFESELLIQATNLIRERIYNSSPNLLKAKLGELSRAKIDYWHQPKLLALLLKHEHIAKMYFGTSLQDTLSSASRLIIDWKGTEWDYHNNAVFVAFALANVGGRIARVEQIYIEMLDSYPCRESESSWIGAVMQEFRFDIDLDPAQSKYVIGQGMNFVYKHGDIDGFKIKLTSSFRRYYKLVVKVQWYDIEAKVMQTTGSEPFLARFPYV